MDSYYFPSLPSDCWYEIGKWCNFIQLLYLVRTCKAAARGITRLAHQNGILLFHMTELDIPGYKEYASEDYINDIFYKLIIIMIEGKTKNHRKRKKVSEVRWKTIQPNMRKLNAFMDGPDFGILQIGTNYYTKITDSNFVTKIKLMKKYDSNIVLNFDYMRRIPPNEFWRYEDILFSTETNDYYVITETPDKYIVNPEKDSDLIYHPPVLNKRTFFIDGTEYYYDLYCIDQQSKKPQVRFWNHGYDYDSDYYDSDYDDYYRKQLWII